ncbi:MAG: M3 family metallopeptidase [Candidatus Limisoma sp.]
MKKTKLTATTLLTAGLLAIAANMNATNPFLSDYNTRFNIPPFERIAEDDYMPALKAGMEQHNKEIQAIIDNTETATFENTIVAFDNAGQLLENVSLAFNSIYEAMSTPHMQKIGTEVFPMLSSHSDEIMMNGKLFARIKTVYDNRESLNLTTPQKRLLEKYYKSFVRNGALLSDEKKAELKKINEELSKLNQKYGDNIVKGVNNWKLVVDNKADLAGLPQSSIDVAAEEAAAAGMPGKWVFTLQAPSRLPFLTYCDNRQLRERLFTAYINLANTGEENDNKALINQILTLRTKKAKLFGFNNYAEYATDNVMAKTPAAAEELLMKVWKPAVAKSYEEIADMQAYVDRHGGDFKIAGWDYYYYADKVKQERFNFDENEVRAYFPIESVRQGIFKMAERLYGITFKEVDNAPVYHPDVKVYEVLDSESKHLATFMTDYYARRGKRQGAWMFVFQEANGTKDIRPIVYNVGNFTKPTADSPSLLTIDEVETMFHEFGHGLHGMLTRSQYKGNAGTNVDRDFVEFPSQLHEHWMFEPELLKEYARHYRTGEVIPDALVNKLIESSKFNQGFANTELVGAALLDLKWHQLTDLEGVNAAEFERSVAEQLGMPEQIPFRYRSTYFNHIFSSDGYAAGYYTYIWAQVLDCDGFEVFQKTGNVFDPATAARLKHVLESGNDEDPMTLYEGFAGHRPDAAALLRDKGLDK